MGMDHLSGHLTAFYMDQLLKNATMASQTFGDLSMKPDESG